ncbi:hypothetical protein [Flavobacterium sp. 140616W15]|uniref:hypothetical protein n=1 Tax=Flavobacterium sp. 140616W15 TaxID=2478552 RepID=UPI0013EDA555|nr:hypothetical protein [Flavobacterium sp. 140616W15]
MKTKKEKKEANKFEIAKFENIHLIKGGGIPVPKDEPAEVTNTNKGGSGNNCA